MTSPTPQSQAPATENKPSDKELNFRALESKLAQERQARLEMEKELQQLKNRPQVKEEDDDDSEPYVDHRKLNKTLQRFGEQSKQQTQGEIQRAVQEAIHEERKQNWIKTNPDFYDVLSHAEKFAQHDPELAETILQMPEGFERQKLVYKNIKALGLHKPEQKAPSIQEKIDANRRSPYYQPSGVGAAPYANAGDFSSSGQKNAYEKMKELQRQLRL